MKKQPLHAAFNASVNFHKHKAGVAYRVIPISKIWMKQMHFNTTEKAESVAIDRAGANLMLSIKQYTQVKLGHFKQME